MPFCKHFYFTVLVMIVNRDNPLLFSIKTSTYVNVVLEILEELCFTRYVPLITLTCRVLHTITQKVAEGLLAPQNFKPFWTADICLLHHD